MTTTSERGSRTAAVLVTKGFDKETGYFQRCVRDASLIKSLGYEVHIVNVSNLLSSRAWREPRAILDSIKVLKSCAVIVIENYGALTFYAVFGRLFRRRARREIFICHGSLQDLQSFRFYRPKRLIYSLLEKSMRRRLTAVACVSEVMRRDFNKKIPGPSPKVVCLPNNPEPEFYREIKLAGAKGMLAQRKELDLPSEKVLFLYAGNSQPWQNLDVLAETCKELHRMLKNSFFVFLTAEELEVKKILDRASLLPEDYRLLRVPGLVVPKYLVAADYLFVLRDQSDVNRVACPTKAIEYLLSGSRLIVSENLGDISGIVDSSGRGIVVPRQLDRSPEEIAKLIAGSIVNSSSPETWDPEFTNLPEMLREESNLQVMESILS